MLLDGLEMGERQKGRSKNDFQISGLNNLVGGYDRTGLRGKQSSSILDMLNLRYAKPNTNICYTGEMRIWNLEQRFELEV